MITGFIILIDVTANRINPFSNDLYMIYNEERTLGNYMKTQENSMTIEFLSKNNAILEICF